MRLQSDVGKVWTLLKVQLEHQRMDIQDIFFHHRCIICLRWNNLGLPRQLSLHALSPEE